MAERLALGELNQLHHLVTAGDATRGVDVDDRPLTMRSVLNAMPPCVDDRGTKFIASFRGILI